MLEAELTIYRTTKVDYDYFYQQSRRHTNWVNPVSDINQKLLFLNQFRCHLPYAIADNILSVLERVSPLFEQLQNTQLQYITENNGEGIYPIITELFDTLRNNVNRFRKTATGKFMHMTCPNLFAMIDSVIAGHMQHNGIIHHYFTSSEDYIRLLEYYRNEINELIEDIIQTHGFDRLEAINRIRGKDIYAEGSILRIIDKHFYWLATH